MTPNEYLDELKSLIEEFSQFHSLDLPNQATEKNIISQHKKVIEETKAVIKKAKLLRKELVIEVREINSRYKAERATAGLGTSILVGGLFGRKWGGAIRADSKRAKNLERVNLVRQYDEIKLNIDKSLLVFEKHVSRTKDLVSNLKNKG